MLHSTKLPNALHCMLPSSQDALKHTPEYAPKYTSNCTRWHTSSLFDYTLPSTLRIPSQVHLQVHSQVHCRACSQGRSKLHLMTLPACLTVCSQVSSQYALKHTPEHAPKYTLQRQDTPNLTDYMLPCMLLGTRSRDLPSCRRQEPGGGWREAGGRRWVVVAVIMISVNIIV